MTMCDQDKEIEGNATLTERQEAIFPIAYVLNAFGKDAFVLTFCCDHSLLLTAMSLFPSKNNSYQNCWQFLLSILVDDEYEEYYKKKLK